MKPALLLAVLVLVLFDCFSDAQINRGCQLRGSAARRYCPLKCARCQEAGACHLVPGSLVQTSAVTRVQCAPGHRLEDDQEYSLVVCDNGTSIGRIPLCLAQCPPLESETMNPECVYNGKEVDCKRPMMPRTMATLECKPNHSKYPPLENEGQYRNLYCRFDATWSGAMPQCKQDCGKSLGSTKVQATVTGKDSLDTKLGVFPWHAGIYEWRDQRWTYICGGSLITKRIVLTAAHCVADTEPTNLRVTFAKYYRSWERDEIYTVKLNVSAVRQPRWFNWAVIGLGWDIALVLLSADVEVNSYVMPVCQDFALAIDNAKNYTGYVVGWGQTAATEPNSDYLLHNDVPISYQDNCKRKVIQSLVVGKFCASKNSTSVVEKGDSGGGLTVVWNNQHFIIGIVSIKIDDVISAFTNVSWPPHQQWLQKEINNLEEEISKCHKGAFQCGGGECVAQSARCDGYSHCLDGSDENGCDDTTTTTNDTTTPITSDAIGICRLPGATRNRILCPAKCQTCSSVGLGCSWLPDDTLVRELAVRVECERGYRLEYDTDYALVNCTDGEWSYLPECVAQCPPLESDYVLVRCTRHTRHVNCGHPTFPGTQATVQCRPAHTEYPNLAETGVYQKPLTCNSDGTWSHSLPVCKPMCGVSKGLANKEKTSTDSSATQLGMFPWHAGIYKIDDKNSWIHTCGGSLVTNQVVLTAAHCLALTSQDYQVAFAKIRREWDWDEPDTVKRSVSAIVIPRELDMDIINLAWDVAFVLLSEPVQITPNVMPVCLNVDLRLDITNDTTVYAAGWASDAVVLGHNGFSFIPNDECAGKITRNLAVDKICGSEDKERTIVQVVDKGNRGACLTAVVNGLHHVIGVLSARYENTTVFTNITWYAPWIKSEIDIFHGVTQRCQLPRFQCGSFGPCLQLSEHCDGRENCPDGSDEVGCTMELEVVFESQNRQGEPGAQNQQEARPQKATYDTIIYPE